MIKDNLYNERFSMLLNYYNGNMDESDISALLDILYETSDSCNNDKLRKSIFDRYKSK